MIVHNISDRSTTDSLPRAVSVGGVVIRPGKAAHVPDGAVTRKVRKLHGTTLWLVRALPVLLRNSSQSALRGSRAQSAPPMARLECRLYLRSLSRADLVMLCGQVSPAVPAGPERSEELLVRALTRALFSGAEASPETFFWLRRWVRRGADFEEID